jgi:hypothetical protein
MSSIKLYIVAAPGGARGDFVAGWLGTIPGFLNSYWNIDQATGVSLGNMGHLRSIDHGLAPTTALNSHQLNLSNISNITWAVSCHGYTLDPSMYYPHIDNNEIKFLSININGADKTIITWEFIVKTYLSERRGLDWAQRNKKWVIDDQINLESITDQDRIDQLQLILKQQPRALSDRSLPITIPSISLDYVKLFKLNGSRYLCNQLNIIAPEYCHSLWNAMIPMADAPNIVTAWGVVWRKADYFPS